MAITTIKRYQIQSLDIVDADILSGANIATSKLADGAEFVKRDGSVVWTSNMDAGGNKLTNLATPTNPNDAIRLVDLQNYQAGLDFKNSVRAASNTGQNITIATPGTSIGGVTLTSGDRVLLKNQTTANQNGIYIWNGSAVAMTRATDADVSSEVSTGLYVFVEEGTQQGTAWVLSTPMPITLGTTNLTFIQFSGAGQLTVSGGLVLSGNDLSVGTASSSRIVINANNIDLATTGVTAGTYTKITVDIYGRITTGATATPADIGAQPAATLLTSLAGLGTNGFLVKNAAGTIVTRDILGTTNNISVTNGDGISGNPTIDLVNTAVTPGTYQGITVDAKGRITAASDQGYFRLVKHVGDETPGGTMNGINTAFTLANSTVSGTLTLTKNGVKMKVGASNDYTYSGANITFVSGAQPRAGDELIADYFTP